MALTYNMRALAQSDNSYVFWESAIVDPSGTNAPEAIVAGTATVVGVVGAALAGGGTPQPHDTTHSPVGLWQLNGDLTDSSGNGFNLTLSTGSAFYTTVFDLPGIFFNGATSLRRPSRDASLAISGNMTIEFIITPPAAGSPFGHVCHFGDFSLETEAGNTQYRIIAVPDVVSCSWEYGAGVDQNMTEVISVGTATCHFAFVRTAGSTEVRRFVNGVLKTVDTSLTPPTGGTASTSILSVGDRGNGGNFLTGFLGSLKIIDGALSDADVKAEYNRTLGPLLGVI